MTTRFLRPGLGRPLGALATTLALLLASAPLYARLPPPTPEQQQAAEAKKAKEAANAKEQADALSRVQDQLVARFGKGGGHGGETDAANVPQKAAEAAGTAGPHGGTSPSAEAHGGEAARK
jgi:hypothetical protein